MQATSHLSGRPFFFSSPDFNIIQLKHPRIIERWIVASLSRALSASHGVPLLALQPISAYHVTRSQVRKRETSIYMSAAVSTARNINVNILMNQLFIIYTFFLHQDFVDIVLSKTQRKTPTVVHRHYKITRIRNFYMRKVKFAQQTFHDKLTQIVTEFPKLDVSYL